ncbi:hypothetical protein BTVI_70199 [Pitangus sulphuratus]|nr:hypothetical protein BTVI_70199 [Pitangus sulphuratus]
MRNGACRCGQGHVLKKVPCSEDIKTAKTYPIPPEKCQNEKSAQEREQKRQKGNVRSEEEEEEEQKQKWKKRRRNKWKK